MLERQHISLEDQEIVKGFFGSFSFTKRQQLMGIFLGFPEQVTLFINLLKKKIEFQKNPSESLSVEILEMEKKEMEFLIKELQ